MRSSDYNSTLSLAVCAHMIIGKSHQLHVSRAGSDTLWLEYPDSGPDAQQFPMPLNEAQHAQPGDTVTAFIYTDGDANPLATIKMPHAELGECASMKVSAVTELGAFLDWGIDKDLFLPFSEQRRPVQEGAKECVMVFLDNTGRLAATSRLDHHLSETSNNFSAWQAVNLLIFQRTDLGFKAVINNQAIGLLYKDEIFTDIKVGQQLNGYVKRLRADHRIDLALQPPSNDVKRELTDVLVRHMQEHDGVLMVTDRSTPETIYDTFGVSKKNFKRALSALYKQRRITIEPDRVVLVKKGH